MPVADFEIIELGDAHVRVRHVVQGHEYTFGRASTADGTRILSAGHARINNAADFGYEAFEADAYVFASERARTGENGRNLIFSEPSRSIGWRKG